MKHDAAGPYATLRSAVPDGVTPTEYRDAVITAGFIDTHVHYPQVKMIGAYGAQLLEWLDRYTFPTELKFADRDYAAAAAQLFMRELLRAGTTTAAVYCTVHPQSVDAFFAESVRYGTCMVAGKVLMDRNAPSGLLEPPQTAYDESARLIERWHKKGRQLYCVTPRFAPTSTEGLLDAAGSLLRAHDGLYLQTHLSENLAEIEWVRSLFPARAGYLDVYAHAGLASARSVFGHGIHLSEQELCTCHATGAALSHCPTSNLFLGSGLFRLFDVLDPRRPVRVGLGTDVGAGTSLSQLSTLGEAYKVAALQGHKLGAIQAFYLATLGGARSLYLDGRLGRLAPGYAADVAVLDARATPLLTARTAHCGSLEDLLFVLMTLGDEPGGARDLRGRAQGVRPRRRVLVSCSAVCVAETWGADSITGAVWCPGRLMTAEQHHNGSLAEHQRDRRHRSVPTSDAGHSLPGSWKADAASIAARIRQAIPRYFASGSRDVGSPPC